MSDEYSSSSLSEVETDDDSPQASSQSQIRGNKRPASGIIDEHDSSRRKGSQSEGGNGFSLHLGDFSTNGPLARTKPQVSSCREALKYLQKIDSEYLPKITSVYIPGGLMAIDDSDNTEYTNKLVSFLTTKLALSCVSLAVPDDLDFGAQAEAGQYERFSWQLHEKLIQTFKKGRLRMLRFVHPVQCPKASEALSVFEFYNTYSNIERMLMPEHEILLCYIRGYNRRVHSENVPKNPRWREDPQAARLHVGYQLDFDEQRESGEGTVIRLRHVHRENPWDHKNAMFM